MTNTEKQLLSVLKSLLHTVDWDPNASDGEIMDAIDWERIRNAVERAEKEDTRINGALCGDNIYCPKGESMWVTAGNASVNVKNGDDGISVSIYPLNCEMTDSLSEAWATHEELRMAVEGEDLE